MNLKLSMIPILVAGMGLVSPLPHASACPLIKTEGIGPQVVQWDSGCTPGGGGCSGPSDYKYDAGSYSYAEASVGANCLSGSHYQGVHYGHYGDETNSQGGGWQERDFSSGCSDCWGGAWSETQVWISRCRSCADFSILDSAAQAHI
jgi:hypothetical protein